MVKSQRSSTTLFHQWPNSSTRNQNQQNLPATPSGRDHRSNNSYDDPTKDGIGIRDGQGQGGNRANLGNITPGLKHPTNPSSFTNVTSSPGSPSQIDPFGSQVTSPSPIYPSNPTTNSNSNSNSSSSSSTTIRSRPPSTVLSSGGSPLPGSNNSAVTPKIILASPSTSTIHYLFPSSDTRNGIHLSASATTTTPQNTASTAQEVRSNHSDPKLKRGQSLSRGNSVKHRNKDNHNSIDQPHREVPGLKNKRSLPTPLIQPQGENQIQASSNRKIQAGSTATGGLKKSDISKPIPSSSDEARDYSKGYYDVGPAAESDADIMGALRRQPGMLDLGGKGRIGLSEKSENYSNDRTGMKRRESLILKEIENRRERRGWEIGSRPTHGNNAIDSPSLRSKTSTNNSRSQIRGPTQKPYIPSITVIQQRRRSQSLTSPRPAPSPPVDPQKSPLLPAPDLGDPLSLSVVIPSPSYSHLDYSPAGSSASSLSKSQSKKGGWGRRSSAIFPLSVAMSRSDTRKGLGDYDAGKLKAKEDYEQRMMNWNNSSGGGGRFGSIKRSLSLRKKGDDEESIRKTRPRSQSLTTTKSFRGLEEAPPLPSPSLMGGSYLPGGYDNRSSAYTGELSIDLGSRYHPHHDNSSATTLELDLVSPRSAETSVFPASTPTTSEFDSNGGNQNVIRIIGKPLHPAFNTIHNGSDSELSILAPSTVGLGFSPIGTPVSLPDSLLEEMVDLTETGTNFNNNNNTNRRVSSPMIESVITPPTPQNQGILPNPALLDVTSIEGPSPTTGAMGGQSQKIPRRSLLLAQNRFYIPSSHPKPVIITPSPDQNRVQLHVQKKPSLRSSKSLGTGIMKRAYTSGNLKADATNQRSPNNVTPSPTLSPIPSTSTSFGRGLLKSASIRSTTKRFSKILENHDDQNYNGHQKQYEIERIPSTSSMRFHRRPLTTFSLCSPSDAIEPLPFDTSPSLSVEHQNARRESKTLRSNKSSPFLSASNSLRVIFGKEGFVARSLSQAFDKEHHNQNNQSTSASHSQQRDRERSSSPNPKSGKGELKLKISSPLEASSPSFPSLSERRTQPNQRSVQAQRGARERTLSPEFEEEAREKGINADRKWRESVLQEALTLSISNSTSLNKLADLANEDGSMNQPRMVSSGSKSRLAIPEKLLSAPEIKPPPGPVSTTLKSYDNTYGIRESMISNKSEGYKGIGENMLNNSNSLESSLNLRAVMEMDNWNLPSTIDTRSIDLVGKEESLMSAPSLYSNNASTLFEKPTRRLQGKGLPSSFSIADLTKRSGSESGSKSKKNEESSSRLKTRLISPPIPISSPLTYNENIHTFDVNTGRKEELDRGVESQRSINNHQTSVGRNLSTRSSLFGLKSKSKSKSPEPISNLPRTASPISSANTNQNQHEGRQTFGLSLRSSLRNGNNNKTFGKNGNNGISSNDPSAYNANNHHQQPLLLDSLISRDTPLSIHPTNEIENPNSDSDPKLRKVLEWRDEVGENEQLARLEQKIRGFVSDERERVRNIGRKSIEG